MYYIIFYLSHLFTVNDAVSVLMKSKQTRVSFTDKKTCKAMKVFKTKSFVILFYSYKMYKNIQIKVDYNYLMKKNLVVKI